jgi:hypothetical protein
MAIPAISALALAIVTKTLAWRTPEEDVDPTPR